MQQLDIFAEIGRAERKRQEFARTHAARRDPATSKVAAHRAHELTRRHYRQIATVLAALPDGGTAHDIALADGTLNNVQVARRMRDMEREGLVVDSGTTRPTPTGRPATVWKIAAKAKESA